MTNTTRLPADLAGALALIDSLTVQRDAAEATARERGEAAGRRVFEKLTSDEARQAIADRDAAQQMVAEMRATLEWYADHEYESESQSDSEISYQADKALALSAPIAGRWCLASERDEAIEKNTSMMATIERLSAACGAAEASAEKAEAREKAIGDELEKATDRIEGLVKENERFRHAAAETADLLMREAMGDKP